MKVTLSIRYYTVNSIYVEDGISFILNTDKCEFNHFPFIGPHHKHIVTGDLRIVENSKPQKLLFKGPNYREPSRVPL